MIKRIIPPITLPLEGKPEVCPIQDNLAPFFQALDGLEPCGPLEVDAAIMEAVASLDTLPGSSAGAREGVIRNPLCHLGRPLSQEEVLTGVLPDLTRRIVAAVQPTRVILFGSAARGCMNPESDLDVLVIVQDGRDQNQASKDLYRCLRGLGFPVDALVICESDLLLNGSASWIVYRNALAEGKELYRDQSQGGSMP